MRVVYADEPLPTEWRAAIFLAGPTPRDATTPSWRPAAIAALQAEGYDGVVLVPEQSNGKWGSGPDAYLAQVEWEKAGLDAADVILFWVPRDMATMPALTTNVEFGRYSGLGKVVLGAPEGAKSVRYLEWLHREADGGPMHATLEATAAAAVDRIAELAAKPGGGDVRVGGERLVPLHIWTLPSFHAWRDSQVAVGNRIDGARLLWHFAPRPGGPTFSWALHVDVWIAAEGRAKTNEFVLARPDIACVVMHRRPPGGDLYDTEIVLIREFRSPGRTSDGYVRELPGGSTLKPGVDPLRLAADEVHEETGLIVDPIRLVDHGSRQLVATLSSHHAHVFSIALEEHEMAQARAVATSGEVHGVAGDTERTYVEIATVREILSRAAGDLDWTALGMILAGTEPGPIGWAMWETVGTVDPNAL